MHRRKFLHQSAGLIFATAGCHRVRSGATSAPGAISADDQTRIAKELAARTGHLELLKKYRVPPTATRTTPPPPLDVLQTIPELKGLIKVTMRLHPRFSDEPKLSDSKIGGRFLWPADEPWPICEEHNEPHGTVLQLKSDDAPPGMPFRPDTDLFQLLWCPRDHNETIALSTRWRKAAKITNTLDQPPASVAAFPEAVPVACRLFLERVMEFPPSELLPGTIRKKLSDLRIPNIPDGALGYDNLLSVCPGSKVGGYPRGIDRNLQTACTRCKWPMDFLLALCHHEWSEPTWKRWMPTEEQALRSVEADQGFGSAIGIRFPEDNVNPINVFICRRCEDWPVRVIS